MVIRGERHRTERLDPSMHKMWARFDFILQFSDIARPRIPIQKFHCYRLDSSNDFSRLNRKFIQEMSNEMGISSTLSRKGGSVIGKTLTR